MRATRWWVAGVAAVSVVGAAGIRVAVGPQRFEPRPGAEAAAPVDSPERPGHAARPSGTPSPTAGGGQTTRTARTSRGVVDLGQPAAPGTPRVRVPAQGVTNDEITIVYYWKGDRTRTSPYLGGSGVEANVDEGVAFRTLVEYVNRNPGASFMGQRIDLHGRKLKPVVLEAGDSPEDYAAVAEKITREIKPFAAIAAHGSISAYVCPRLAKAGIFGLATYDVDFGVLDRTGGWCRPGAASFDAQVEATVGYLSTKLRHTRTTAGAQRVFGFAYAEYPGLVDAAPAIVKRLKAAGVPVAATGSASAELATAQQQAGSLVAKFRDAGVNTVVIPDAGLPLSFTQAAATAGWRPDYYVWPCSGQDNTGMVRLYNGEQWSRAGGLTCYDPELNPDLAVDDTDRNAEWYRQYRSVPGAGEPPAPTAFVYASLAPLVAGIAGAGRALDATGFADALGRVPAYRYDARTGRTTDGRSMLLTPAARDGSLIGDFTLLAWDPAARRAGSSLAGAYVYPDGARRRARWR